MKRLLTSILLMSAAIFAQAEGKIAVVNLERAILNTDVAKSRMEALEADEDLKKLFSDAQNIKTELIKLGEEFKKEAPTMSARQQEEFEARAKSKQADLEHINRKLQEVQAGLYKQLMQDMNVQAVEAAKEIVDSEGIGLLLNYVPQQIIWHADTSFDITAKVTDKLNKQQTK